MAVDGAIGGRLVRAPKLYAMDAGAEEQLTNGINETSCGSSRFDATDMDEGYEQLDKRK
jgi:hypothetical protein